MNPQKKMVKIEKNSSNSNAAGNNRKPRRSIKAEGNCLNSLLREGCAKVIDASKLGKRLSSEIWNSFGAIQVEDNFTYPAIETKTVADGSSTLKICQFFVACSKCFSVFKYDGHAYGTTGLVKHVKICQNTNQRANSSSTTYQTSATATTTTTTPNATTTIDHNIDSTHTSSSVPNNTTTTTATTTINGPVSTRRKREPTNKSRNAHPSLRHLAKVIDELRCEQSELRQKILELINMINGTSYVGQIQIIANDGDKVEDELQKTE